MRKFHMEENGWSDLAQHLTIGPQGGLWTGRNWNLAPANATGHNGTAGEGPFMIEMVGDSTPARIRSPELSRASRCGRRPNGVVHM